MTTPPQPQVEIEDTLTPPPRNQTLMRVLAIVVVVAITVGILLLGDQSALLDSWGHLGIFLINLFASATIVLPAPGLLIVFAAGARLVPFWVGVAAALGSMIGETSGYLAGYSGRAVVENRKQYDKVVDWTERYGLWTLVVLAFIPNPLFDIAGIAAGVLKMPLRTFWLATLAGKLPKMWLVAYAGFHGVAWVEGFL